MCGGSDAPEPPDPWETAAAQAKFSKEAAIESAKISAVDQYGPFGSTVYQRNPDGTPSSQTVNLSPQMQAWLDSQFGASTKLQNTTSRQLDFLPQDKFQLPGDVSADGYARGAFGDELLDPSSFSDTRGIAQASYDQAKSLFQPDIEQRRKQTEAMLTRRGINPGDEIWQDEVAAIDRNENNLTSQASRQATLDAGNEQSRRVNTATQALNYGNNAYQTNLGNQMLERQQPFQEASALMGNTPQFGTPAFMNTAQTNVAAPDFAGARELQYKGQMANWEADQAKWGSIAGLFGSGAKAASMMSDENLKEDRSTADGEAILSAFREMPVDDYRYKDEARAQFDLPERRTGPMAQDYAEQFDGDGETIDLGDMLGKLLAGVKALDARTQGMRAA
jgi:hypothetical protein